MATTGVVNGTLIKLKLGGNAVANLISNDENLQTALREVTTKDSAGDAAFAGGKRSADYNAKLLHIEGATNGFSSLFAGWQAATVYAAVITSGVSGDKKYTASVLIKSLKRTAAMEANVEADVALQVTGAITEGTE